MSVFLAVSSSFAAGGLGAFQAPGSTAVQPNAVQPTLKAKPVIRRQ